MNIQDILKQAKSLKPTATIVRDPKGRVRVERDELLSSTEREQLVQVSIEAGQRRVAARTGKESDTMTFPIPPGDLFEFNKDKECNGVWELYGSNDSSAPCIHPPSKCSSPGKLIRVATFNVWFSEYQWKLRLEGLVELLICDTKNNNAHIVCLQEVTPRFLIEIMRNEIIRERYCVAHNTIRSYGACMLFDKHYAFPLLGGPPNIVTVPLPTQMGRAGLIAEFSLRTTNGGNKVDKKILAIGTVHLESLKSKDSRTQQLQILNKALEPFDTAILCGDYNITATGPWADREEHDAVTQKLLPDFDDLWVRENGTDDDDSNDNDLGKGKSSSFSGLTYDTSQNSMLKNFTRFEDRSRYDRVCVKEQHHDGSTRKTKSDDDDQNCCLVEEQSVERSELMKWTCQNIRIIGNKPIQKKNTVEGLITSSSLQHGSSVDADDTTGVDDVFISDHFGLAFEVVNK